MLTGGQLPPGFEARGSLRRETSLTAATSLVNFGVGGAESRRATALRISETGLRRRRDGSPPLSSSSLRDGMEKFVEKGDIRESREARLRSTSPRSSSSESGEGVLPRSGTPPNRGSYLGGAGGGGGGLESAKNLCEDRFGGVSKTSGRTGEDVRSGVSNSWAADGGFSTGRTGVVRLRLRGGGAGCAALSRRGLGLQNASAAAERTGDSVISGTEKVGFSARRVGLQKAGTGGGGGGGPSASSSDSAVAARWNRASQPRDPLSTRGGGEPGGGGGLSGGGGGGGGSSLLPCPKLPRRRVVGVEKRRRDAGVLAGDPFLP